MKSAAAVVSFLLLVVVGFFVFVSGLGWPAWSENGLNVSAGAVNNVASYEDYINLTSTDLGAVNSAISNIDRGWHPGGAAMLLESARFSASLPAFEQIFGLLEQKTKQPFGRQFDRWYQWIWQQNFELHPEYAKFKAVLYSRIDPRFTEYFADTENAKIRLDEVQWGGVVRDGIPPLENPSMISAKQATYLEDTNIVFGVELNGDARCYPKRVLAWHEMFKDTIGGEPVCGVY